MIGKLASINAFDLGLNCESFNCVAMAYRPRPRSDGWYETNKFAKNKKIIATGFGLSLKAWDELQPRVYERARQIKPQNMNYRDDTSKHLQDQHVDLLYNSFRLKLAPVPDAWKKSAMTHILGKVWPKMRNKRKRSISTESIVPQDTPSPEPATVSKTNTVELESVVNDESSIREENDHREDWTQTLDPEAWQSITLSLHPPRTPGHSPSSPSLDVAYTTTPQRRHFSPTSPAYTPTSPAHHPGVPLVASASTAAHRPSLNLHLPASHTPISGEVIPSIPATPSNLPSDKMNQNPDTLQSSVDPLSKPLRLHFYITNEAAPIEKLVAVFSTRFLCYPNSSPPKISLGLLTDTAEEVLEKMHPLMKLGAELFLDKWSAPDLPIFDEITLNTAIYEILEQGHTTASLRMKILPVY